MVQVTSPHHHTRGGEESAINVRLRVRVEESEEDRMSTGIFQEEKGRMRILANRLEQSGKYLLNVIFTTHSLYVLF